MKRLLTWLVDKLEAVGIWCYQMHGKPVYMVECDWFPIHATWAQDGGWWLFNGNGAAVKAHAGLYTMRAQHVMVLGPLSLRWDIKPEEVPEL